MIRLDNVTKIYKGDTRAIDGVSLNIDKGEFVFFGWENPAQVSRRCCVC